MRVRFTRDFDWRVPERKGRVTLAYKAGQEVTVRRVCGEAAVKAGAAEEVEAKRDGDGS